MPAASVDVIVTSPPYNLGIRLQQVPKTRCRRPIISAGLPRGLSAAARVLRPGGSLFLNVGTPAVGPMDGARRRAGGPGELPAPEHHPLGEIDCHRSRQSAGVAADLQRDLAVGHYKPINSNRYPQRLPRVRLSLHAVRRYRARPSRARRALPGSVEYRPLARGGRRRPLPRQYLVHPVRDDPAPRPRSAASGDVPDAPSRTVPETARPVTHQAGDGSVHRAWEARRSPARGWASTSRGVISTRPTWPKRSSGRAQPPASGYCPAAAPRG